jgi:DNA-binding transcriptional LysR family regulator
LEIGHAIPALTLRQMTYFLAAARHQSILKAAEQLNVSSPSISTAISQMEETLDLKLFERRHARGLLLTAAGSDLAGHLRSILLHVREIEAIRDRGVVGSLVKLNVGCLNTLAPYVLPAMMKVAEEKRGRFQMRWSEDSHENLLKALHSGAIDLALVYNYDLPTTLQTTVIRSMPVQAVLPASHRLAQKSICQMSDLAGEPMVLLDLARTRDYFLSLFSSAGIEPHIVYRSSAFETVRSLVANGFGYTLLNFSPPYQSDGGGSLVSRPLDIQQSDQNLVLARLYRLRTPPFIQDVIDSARDVVGRLAISS